MTSSTTSAESPARARLPTALTLVRLALAPAIAALILLAGQSIYSLGLGFAGLCYIAACALFVVAAATDWLDGALARRLGAVSALGAALDHVADKALIAAALVALAATALPLDLIVAGLILILRDLVIGGLREAMPGRLAVDSFGKYKAAAAMAGIAFYLAFQAASILGGGLLLLQALIWLARTLIWTGALLALLSAGRYLTSLRA